MSNAAEEEIHVLHVEDEPGLADVVAMYLERQREVMTVVTESSAEDGLERLAASDVDCIVSDHDMPGMNGLEFLRAVRKSHPELPFILFTGKGSEEIASDAISAGVTEYLQKETGTEQYTVLANRIERAVSAERAKRALEESERKLSTLISNLPGTVYRCRNEPGWPMTFVSDGARELTGYSPAAIESGAVSWGNDVVVESDRQATWDRVQTAVNAGDPFEVTYRTETADGEERWVWERGRVVDSANEAAVIEGFITDITARKKREQELRTERRFTENVVNSLEDIFFVVGTDGNLTRWNNRITEVTGYTDEEVSAMDATEFFTADDRGDIVDAISRALDGEQVRVEANAETKTGQQIPFEFRGTALYDANGNVMGVSGIGRDVSERKAREAELEQYRTLVESVGDPMYVTDADRTITMINEAMASHIGYDREAVVGESVRRFATDESVERANELIEELLADDERAWATFEMQTITADGTRRDNEDMIAVLTDDDGAFQGSVGVIRDISDRKQRERRLTRYETLAESVSDRTYVMSPEGTIEMVNDAMAEFLGYARDDIVGRTANAFMPEADVRKGEGVVRELLDDEDRTWATFEMRSIAADGTVTQNEDKIAVLTDEDGNFDGSVGVVRDISERKERERRLEGFANVVSHDLRNPLQVVQSRVQLARETGDVENLDAASDAAERMECLIDDLLRLAQDGRDLGTVQSVDVGVIATDAWNNLVTDGASLTVDTTRTVEADPDRLGELFENLFRNAIQHGANADEDRPLTVRVGDTDDGFFVEDDGVGIDPDTRDAVFERGYTTNTDGTGFGLAIVESIASAHDWTISIPEQSGSESEGRRGARFEIAL